MHIMLYVRLFTLDLIVESSEMSEFSVRQRVCRVLQQEPMLILSKCINQIFLLNLQLWLSSGGVAEMC